jgi:pyruvate/2-oxoglutarate/acetoin dehydrogenase E1 component
VKITFTSTIATKPLSESTIVGTSVGRALAGGKPVAFIQFADFLPLAFNQILCELGTMYWRTAGAWECPPELISKRIYCLPPKHMLLCSADTHKVP